MLKSSCIEWLDSDTCGRVYHVTVYYGCSCLINYNIYVLAYCLGLPQSSSACRSKSTHTCIYIQYTSMYTCFNVNNRAPGHIHMYVRMYLCILYSWSSGEGCWCGYSRYIPKCLLLCPTARFDAHHALISLALHTWMRGWSDILLNDNVM